MDKAAGPERSCRHLDGYVRRTLKPNKICEDRIEFLERTDNRGTRVIKLKKKSGNGDIFQEGEYCIDMKQDNASQDKDFVVEICMEMKENMKFK